MKLPEPANGPASLADHVLTQVPIEQHLDAVRPHHRFKGVARSGVPWDLSHLEPFAFRVNPGLGFDLTVVVLFSCHCFTRSLSRDGRSRHQIPAGEIFDDRREVRVLCEERYELSRRFLPELIRKLHRRVIRFAREAPQNFVTIEALDDGLETERRHYVVFIAVQRDTKRKRQVFMQVQSAYVKHPLEPWLSKGRRISLERLLSATTLGKRLTG